MKTAQSGANRLNLPLNHALVRSLYPQTLDPHRATVDKTASMIRWTLNPSVTYSDMIDLLDRHEKVCYLVLSLG